MYDYYFFFFGLIIIVGIFASAANNNVQRAFRAQSGIYTRSHMTGYDTATRLLRLNGITDVSIGRVKGNLTDHYHPVKGVVNLSDSVYNNDSIAAVAVAAHEIGHVVQNKKGYLPYKLRSWLVPITNFGSKLALPLVLLGLILDIAVGFTQEQTLGYILALVGVGLYGLSTVFALVTLPVEYNASRRAERMLVEAGIVSESERPYVRRMLNAAAQTYLAALATSLVYFLRFAVWVLMIFGNRSRRD